PRLADAWPRCGRAGGDLPRDAGGAERPGSGIAVGTAFPGRGLGGRLVPGSAPRHRACLGGPDTAPRGGPGPRLDRRFQAGTAAARHAGRGSGALSATDGDLPRGARPDLPGPPDRLRPIVDRWPAADAAWRRVARPASAGTAVRLTREASS